MKNFIIGSDIRQVLLELERNESLQGKSYPNVSQYLLSEYEDLLTKKDRVFLEMLSSYKRNIITRLKLIFDKDFRRDTLKGTAILKTGVLLGWL